MYNLDRIQSDLKISFIALINQQQLQIEVKRNWPAPETRKVISPTTLAQLSTWFINNFPTLAEVSPFYPLTKYRYEVATSGSTDGVHDFKISPKNGGTTIFNYHVQVTNE